MAVSKVKKKETSEVPPAAAGGAVITPEQAGSITDVEMAFSCDRFLPGWESIPQEFRKGNHYTRLAEAIMFRSPLPDGNIEVKDGFTVEMLQRVTLSHLASYGPKHEHKIAGVGYLIASMCEFTPDGA